MLTSYTQLRNVPWQLRRGSAAHAQSPASPTSTAGEQSQPTAQNAWLRSRSGSPKVGPSGSLCRKLSSSDTSLNSRKNGLYSKSQSRNYEQVKL